MYEAMDQKMYESSVIRYIFFGGCTTMVNLVSFFILRKLKVELNIANIISIILAILFAYVVNSKYVFQDKCETLKDHVQPFCKFVSARLVTMVIEVGGVWLLVSVMGLNDMIGKFLTQFIVLILNYVFSKFLCLLTGKSNNEGKRGNYMTLEEAIAKIKPLDHNAMEIAQKRWDSIAKPLHSLGKLETLLIQIAGITGNAEVDLSRRGLIAMCADNGVVEEGVTQTGQEVTAIVAENFLKYDTSVGVMCKQNHAEIFPVDMGMVTDTKVRTDHKIAYGTQNMTKGPAMTREQAVKGLEAGIDMVRELNDKGYRILATGEMGIGNTTTSSAVASVLLKQPVEEMTGRGAGLTSEGLVRKINAIKKAIALNEPDPEDAIDVLAKVGGLDIAGMAGVFLGGAVLWYSCSHGRILFPVFLR